MPNAWPRRATALPMRPRPARPRVVPRTGRLTARSQPPARVPLCWFARFLASPRVRAKVCSATESWLAAGVLGAAADGRSGGAGGRGEEVAGGAEAGQPAAQLGPLTAVQIFGPFEADAAEADGVAGPQPAELVEVGADHLGDLGVAADGLAVDAQ